MADPQRRTSPVSWFLRADSARRARALALAVLVTFAFLILPSWNTWRFYQASAELSTQELRLQQLIGRVIHIDEVLTMSARMAAVTGDPRWEQRYREAEPKLEAAIQAAIQLAAGDAGAFDRIDAANRELVAMENRAFDLARAGRRREAQELLSSRAYERNKRAYAEGIAVLTSRIEARIQDERARSERGIVGAGVLTVLGAATLVLAWVGVVVLIWRHLSAHARAAEERKRLEAQIQHMQKLESLGVLAGGIAHDFNNLLMPILGNAELVLAELPADSANRAKLERLRDAGARLSGLTGQLLAYTGKGSFVAQGIHLSKLVEEMAPLLEMSVSKKATLEYELPEDLSPIEGDASQLSQVVMNLVTNASDALGHESGVIAVRTGLTQADEEDLAASHGFEAPPEGPYVYLEVADSGSGMNVATRQRVFDPFFTTKRTGRGLGLAVIHGIVRAHRGVIRLESEAGRGTTFRILFPCSEATVEPPAPPRDAPAVEPWHTSGGALVVDDEADVRELVEIMLGRFGFQVLAAEDGNQGVEAFRKHADQIDVVLLDLTMPGMGGEEALAEIRRIRPDQRVVLMSGYNEEFVASRFADAISSFVQKPFTQEVLQEALRPLVPERDSRGEERQP